MSRGSVVSGTCPRCFTEQPLIWDGTVRPHSVDEDGIRWECEGSLHAPASGDPLEEFRVAAPYVSTSSIGCVACDERVVSIDAGVTVAALISAVHAHRCGGES